MSILFVDMRGFTALGNQLTPEEVQETVNSFLSNMVKYVEEMDGMVDKFLGDGLMAIFGAPCVMKPMPGKPSVLQPRCRAFTRVGWKAGRLPINLPQPSASGWPQEKSLWAI